MDNVTKFFLLCAYPDLALDAENKWITINGTHVQVGEGGELKGKVGQKIKNSGSKTLDLVRRRGAEAEVIRQESQSKSRNEGRYSQDPGDAPSPEDMRNSTRPSPRAPSTFIPFNEPKKNIASRGNSDVPTLSKKNPNAGIVSFSGSEGEILQKGGRTKKGTVFLVSQKDSPGRNIGVVKIDGDYSPAIKSGDKWIPDTRFKSHDPGIVANEYLKKRGMR